MEKNEFETYLISNASMDIYPDNTLSSFTNRFYELQLLHDGKWNVSLSSINYPTLVKNVTDGRFFVYIKEMNNDGDAFIFHRTLYHIKTGIYTSVTDILKSIKDAAKEIEFTSYLDPITRKLTVTFDSFEGISFPSKEIPSLLGFEGRPDDISLLHDWVQIGNCFTHNDQKKYIEEDGKQYDFTGEYPTDIVGDTDLIFVYVNIIDHQYVGDTKAPLLKVFNRKCQIKNNEIATVGMQSDRFFQVLDYKSILISSIQYIKVELRTSTGKLIPFLGSGRTTLTLKFRKS